MNKDKLDKLSIADLDTLYRIPQHGSDVNQQEILNALLKKIAELNRPNPEPTEKLTALSVLKEFNDIIFGPWDDVVISEDLYYKMKKVISQNEEEL